MLRADGIRERSHCVEMMNRQRYDARCDDDLMSGLVIFSHPHVYPAIAAIDTVGSSEIIRPFPKV